ncbi:MAG: class II fructose-bisphosphate aldolase, partial [Thermoanaerobaculia bacterium]|nr:class II fructose-bisphosphate aldolase [Thermoanaerobaculia bacterium]
MLVDLKTLLDEALRGRHGVAAFNVYGYEEARAVVDAAEELGSPVVLAASPTCLRFLPLEITAPMLTAIGRAAAVPVCVHLDHGPDLAAVVAALDLGFTSVMFDGSTLPLDENVAATRHVVAAARARGASIEAAVGHVPGPGPSARRLADPTDPDAAGRFVGETGIDALAVSIGTIHHLEEPAAEIDWGRLAAIEGVVDLPLVLHGGSGVTDGDLRRLAATSV